MELRSLLKTSSLKKGMKDANNSVVAAQLPGGIIMYPGDLCQVTNRLRKNYTFKFDEIKKNRFHFLLMGRNTTNLIIFKDEEELRSYCNREFGNSIKLVHGVNFFKHYSYTSVEETNAG